jgi:predicted PolB exonuclease-like 3'-5' exonuclease
MGEFVIAWDIETTPDLDAFAAAKSLTGESLEAVREAMGDSFPKLPYHKIICIGALIAERVSEGWQVRSAGAPHIGERSEAELIQAFVKRLDDLSPRLITFNGSSFDLPVIRYRAMKNRISARGLSQRPYFNRYTEDALDLCDALSSFDARAKISLDELAKVLGLPGKPADIKGSQVEQFFLEGKIQEISQYCVSDVVNTYCIWLRYEFFRGAVSQKELEFSEASVSPYLEGRQK